MDALQDEAEPLPNMHYDAPVMKQLYVRGENVCGDFPTGIFIDAALAYGDPCCLVPRLSVTPLNKETPP